MCVGLNAWSPASLQDKIQRSQVKLAVQKIQEAADRFIEPFAVTRSTQSSTSAAGVGDMLAGLMVGSAGSAPSLASAPRTGGGSRSTKAAVRLGQPSWSDSPVPGWTRTTVPVQVVGGPPAGSRVRIEIGIGTDGGTERSVDDKFLRNGGWNGSDDTSPALITPGSALDYWFESSDDIAVDVTTRILNEEDDE